MIRFRAPTSRPLTRLGLGLALLVGSTSLVLADAIAEFYAGKTVRVLIGASPGGGQDTQIRLVARYLANYIPGKPTVIAVNMPGGGQRRATEYLYNVAPKDGTVIGQVHPNLPMWQMIEGNVAADARQLQWLGSPGPIIGTLGVWHTKGVANIAQARQKETNFGSSGVGTLPDVAVKVTNEVAGTKFRLVRGYPGSAEQDLALERDELDGRYHDFTSLKTSRPAWIADKKLKFIVQFGAKAKELPDVPLLEELAKTPGDRELAELLVGSGHGLGRPYAVAPGVPADRVAALRAAFEAVLADPGFRKEAGALFLEISMTRGEDLQKTVNAVLNSSPDTIERAKKLLKE